MVTKNNECVSEGACNDQMKNLCIVHKSGSLYKLPHELLFGHEDKWDS